jgi:hypothetical protein
MKDYPYELMTLNQEHKDMWVHQPHIRKNRPKKLSNTPDSGIMKPPHLNHIKGGTPNPGIQWHTPALH